MPVRIHPSWAAVLDAEFSQPYFQTLTTFVRQEYLLSKIYPPPAQIFRAFDATPFEQVRVVILGQDPYHGRGQANGLCFSVNPDVRLPPSLQNIYKEMQSDLGQTPPVSGNLTHLASQGVLLLNATLTVEADQPGSHQNRGWEKFTDTAVATLNERRAGIVFLLWGAYAQKKGALLDHSKHLVLNAAHPSPFSAHSGFFGCRHFSKTNAYLKARGDSEIDWVGSPNT